MQPALAAWVTVSVRPATVNVPLRCEELVDAATENATLPFPLPLDPDVTVIHEALLCAVQLQPAAVVTADDPEPPAPTTESVVGVTAYEQLAAAWVTVNDCPATAMTPWRDCASVLAAAEKKTVPLPLPFAPAVTVNHDGAPLDADHMHPAGAVTAVDPVLALAATDALPGAIEYEQLGDAAD